MTDWLPFLAGLVIGAICGAAAMVVYIISQAQE